MGGVLSTGGERYAPYLQAGIGARLSSYTFSDQSSDLRGSGVYQIGGGFDAWLRKDLVVGVSAQFVGALGAGTDDSFAFETGAHAGYAWWSK